MSHCVQEQVVSINRYMCNRVVTDSAHLSPLLFASFYLIPFSEVLHVQATLHDDPRHVPAQDEGELTAWLLDIQRVSLHRQRCSAIAPWEGESFWLQPMLIAAMINQKRKAKSCRESFAVVTEQDFEKKWTLGGYWIYKNKRKERTKLTITLRLSNSSTCGVKNHSRAAIYNYINWWFSISQINLLIIWSI